MASLKKITIAVFLAASFSLIWQFYRMDREADQRQRLYEEHGIIVCKMGPSTDETARMLIEFLLMLALAGSRLKGLTNTLLNVVGLSGALIVYIFWWHYIFRIAENAGVPVETIPNFAYLARGNFLDIVLVTAIVLLVLLNIRRAALLSFRLSLD